MSQYFNAVKVQAKERIGYATIEDLNSTDFLNKLLAKYQIKNPELDTQHTSVEIGSEMIGSQNLPDIGIYYTPGREMNYVRYTIPVKGERTLFNEVISPFQTRNLGIMNGGLSLWYKIHSVETITGNDTENERLRQIAGGKFREIQQALESLKVKVDRFNNSELDSFIRTEIDEEIKKRTVVGDSKNKLNPFA